MEHPDARPDKDGAMTDDRLLDGAANADIYRLALEAAKWCALTDAGKGRERAKQRMIAAYHDMRAAIRERERQRENAARVA